MLRNDRGFVIINIINGGADIRVSGDYDNGGGLLSGALAGLPPPPPYSGERIR